MWHLRSWYVLLAMQIFFINNLICFTQASVKGELDKEQMQFQNKCSNSLKPNALLVDEQHQHNMVPIVLKLRTVRWMDWSSGRRWMMVIRIVLMLHESNVSMVTRRAGKRVFRAVMLPLIGDWCYTQTCRMLGFGDLCRLYHCQQLRMLKFCHPSPLPKYSYCLSASLLTPHFT